MTCINQVDGFQIGLIARPHLGELVEVAGALQGAAPVGGADGHVVLAPAAGYMALSEGFGLVKNHFICFS